MELFFSRARRHTRSVVASLLAFACVAISPSLAAAQSLPAPPLPPRSATEPTGILPEPDVITRLAVYADRHLSKGDLTNGLKLSYGSMIAGSGFITVGPSYRHWFAKDKAVFDASAGISSNNYRRLQARFELPKIAQGRVSLGTEARFQDFRAVDFFGEGPASTQDARTDYRLKSSQIAGYVTLRPFRYVALSAEAGWMRPSIDVVPAGTDPAAAGARTFLPAGVSLTIDGRDFPSHPTRGGLLRGSALHYSDRTGGHFNFTQYEGQAAAFLPLAGGRFVVALHGWGAAAEGANVPFYLQPSLGGSTTLRSFRSYRFHDRNALVVNAELRIALFTHADLVGFMDAGNVALNRRDLDLAKRSYGAGFRLHTRRQTFLLLDAAHGTEGWQILLRLNDPLNLSRTLRRIASVPFVP